MGLPAPSAQAQTLTVINGNAPICRVPVPLDLAALTNGQTLTNADLGVILGSGVQNSDAGNAASPAGNANGDFDLRYTNGGTALPYSATATAPAANRDSYSFTFPGNVQVIMSQRASGGTWFDVREKWTLQATGGTFSLTDTGSTYGAIPGASAASPKNELQLVTGNNTATMSFVPTPDEDVLQPAHVPVAQSNWRIVSTPMTGIRFNFDHGIAAQGTGANGGGMLLRICATDNGDAPGYTDAAHWYTPGYKIGALLDAEGGARTDANATGDDIFGPDADDEDGVTLPSMKQGQTVSIPVSVTGAGGYLNAWIDFNGNNVFDSGEQIATDVQDGGAGDTGSTANSITLSVAIPANAVTTRTFARFRWSTASGLSPSGTAIDGEVEDHSLTITVPNPIVATNDTATGVNGQTGAVAVVNAFSGDTINGVAASAANATLSVASGSSVPAGLTFNTATGAVNVAAGTLGGTYSFNYQICEQANPSNCKVATISVTVSPYADIKVEKTDNKTVTSSGDTNTYVITVTNNGPSSITGIVVKDQVIAGLTCAASAPVAISGPGTPAGSYTYSNLSGAGITLATLANGDVVTLTYSCLVN